MSALDPFSDPGFRANAYQNQKLDEQTVQQCRISWQQGVDDRHPLAALVKPLIQIGCAEHFLFSSDESRLILLAPSFPEEARMSIEILPDGYRECRLDLKGAKSRSIVSDYPERDPAVMEFLDRLAAFQPK